MTNYMMKKLEKAKWRYQLHDEMGCIREFKEKDSAIHWKSLRPELKLVIVKPPKFDPKSISQCYDPFNIPF